MTATDEDLLKGIFRLCEESGYGCYHTKGQVTITHHGEKVFRSKNLDETFLKMTEIWLRVHAPKPALESRGTDAEDLLDMAKGHEALIAHNKRGGDGEGQP